jgi:hypothetical protein
MWILQNRGHIVRTSFWLQVPEDETFKIIHVQYVVVRCIIFKRGKHAN